MYTSHPDWAPSLHMGHTEVKVTNTERYERREKRKRQKTGSAPPVNETVKDQTVVDDISGLIPPVESDPDDEGPTRECGMCPKRRDVINQLLEENRALKRELSQTRLDEDFLKDDDAKVKYYTGLPHMEVLMGLLSSVLPFMTQSSKVLSPFQMLFMTLMRLRQNFPMQHIANIFNVDRTTASRTFHNTISVLNSHISSFISWPGRDALCATMPPQFVEALGQRVAIIVDCIEILTQKQSNPEAQEDSHSGHNTTMKYLIAVTPHGAISFVSKGWSGHVCDKDLIENCGFLDKLSPGDLVLAHRGFDIQDGVGLMCAEVKIPDEGHYQLDAMDVESTKKIAHLRIPVGRMIRSIQKKYAFLSSKMKNHILLPYKSEEMTFLDEIVSVCCALANMSPNVEEK